MALEDRYAVEYRAKEKPVYVPHSRAKPHHSTISPTED